MPGLGWLVKGVPKTSGGPVLWSGTNVLKIKSTIAILHLSGMPKKKFWLTTAVKIENSCSMLFVLRMSTEPNSF